MDSHRESRMDGSYRGSYVEASNIKDSFQKKYRTCHTGCETALKDYNLYSWQIFDPTRTFTKKPDLLYDNLVKQNWPVKLQDQSQLYII